MPSTPSPPPEESGTAEADDTPGAYPHPAYYAYGTPGSPSQSGENGVQVMYPPPPGGYWPPGYMAIPVPMHMPGGVGTNPNGKPKRKQVKNACTNCQTACKRCEDVRPCSRCVKYGLADTCVNSARKERKKGIKRGPYKKRKEDEDNQMDMDDPGVAMEAMMPPGAPYHASLPPGYPEGGYYSYFPGYAFSGGPGHLVPASHEGEDGDEDGEDGHAAAAAAAAAHAYYPHMYPYYAQPPPPEHKEGDEDDEDAQLTQEEAVPAPASPPPAPPKKARKKAAAGGEKPKAARGRKKKAAAAPAPPPPVEEDELEPEQDDLKDDDEW